MSSRKTGYRALLIDLDGTLLDLDIERFISAYTDALSARFAAYVNREDFISHLFGATGVMVENDDPCKSNEAVFYEDFCRRIGCSYSQIKPVIDDFYSRDFQVLSRYSRKHPYSGAVIEAAKRKNMTVILATNPIFPAPAVLQRLSWSGLSEQNFQLITTMENMHFCKPKKEYYLEISEKTGFHPGQCLMAGNDTLEDLNASEAGMGTFLVEDFILQRGNEEPLCDYRGSLKELAGFIESLS